MMEQGRCGNHHPFPLIPGTQWGCRSPGKGQEAVTKRSVLWISVTVILVPLVAKAQTVTEQANRLKKLKLGRNDT